MYVIFYVSVWEECVAVCVALFADLNVRIVLRGPPPAPAAIHMGHGDSGELAELRFCVCDKAKRHTAFY